MLLIVITPETNLPHEHQITTELFNAGLTHFHIRKPNFSKAALAEYIEQIPLHYHKNIIIHAHYELAITYNLKGIHLTEKAQLQQNSTLFEQFNHKTISASFHSFPNLLLNKHKYDYVFLSPIFNSISKQNYLSDFNETELTSFLNKFHKQGATTKVIALGGINTSNIPKVKSMKFDGIAVIGSLWQTTDPVTAFRMLQAHLQG